MIYFNSETIRTSITAVQFFNNGILAGVGDFLYIFDKTNCQFLRKFKIFGGHKIHGIVPDMPTSQCILFSGEYLKIFLIKGNFQDLKELASKHVSDWILDAKWIKKDFFATISMHNKLQIWSSSLEIIRELACNKCILYSAHIYVEDETLIIFSGTVFSEVLVWNGQTTDNGRCQILKKLQGHKGVIFSLNYNPSNGFLCSTSDDRSAILWHLKKDILYSLNQNQNIHYIKVHGHISRIFRCIVLKNCFITAGEDSVVNIWSLTGDLLRKIETHQGGPVWALDCEENKNLVIIGGNDGGLAIFPLTISSADKKLLLPDSDKPKIVGILNNSNLVVLSEKAIVYKLIHSTNSCFKIDHIKELEKYALLEVSPCRNLIGLAGFHGEIYIYQEEKDALNIVTQYQMKEKSRIFSFHWITCSSFLICQYGNLILYFLKNNIPITISKFILPISKERWTTCALSISNHVIVGDRKGDIHLYNIGNPIALQTLKRVHSVLGVTKLLIEKDLIVSLGRCGRFNTFSLENNKLVPSTTVKLPFNWLLNVVDGYLFAFNNSDLIIWDRINQRTLFEIPCGGGHRSWDISKGNSQILFSYIKDKVINISRLDTIMLSPKNLISGYHIDEVNYVDIIHHKSGYILFSGGEDTTLRITTLLSNKFEQKLVLKSHLSSIRTICSYNVKIDGINQVLLFSAGGRAQIICWQINIDSIKCREHYNYYEPLSNEDGEVRIMDVFVTYIKNISVLFCACSDGNIKIFCVGKHNNRYNLCFCRNIFYKLKCIMKVAVFNILGKSILVSMATDGCVTFWDISDVFSNVELQLFESFKVHQSGINSYHFKLLNNNTILFLTGGDDNAVSLQLLQFSLNNNILTVKEDSKFIDISIHCAQVTGVYLGEKHFMTASIDQRIALFSWRIENGTLECYFITKYNTVIPDIKGIKCFEKSDTWEIFIYGNGIEFLKMVTRFAE